MKKFSLMLSAVQTKSKEAQHGREKRQQTKRIGRGEGCRTIHDWRSIQFVPSTQNDWLCSSSLGHFLISTHTQLMWETEEKEQESKQQNELSFSRAAFQKNKLYGIINPSIRKTWIGIRIRDEVKKRKQKRRKQFSSSEVKEYFIKSIKEKWKKKCEFQIEFAD